MSSYGGAFGFDSVNRMNAFEGRTLSYGTTHPQALLTSSKSGTPSLDFVYDANGNLTQRQYLDSAGVEQTQTLVWDNANQLRSLTQGSTVETYWYDADGQRVRKQRGSVTSYYPNRYHEQEGSVVSKVYYLGDMPVALRPVGSSSYTYLHTDAVGSVVLTTQGQTVTGSRWYRAYGAKRSGNDFSFERNYTGQHLDDTGLLYYGARYYDPTAGRFISPDSIVPDPGNVLDYNRYAYARGNPLKYNDPTGHCAEAGLSPVPCQWMAQQGMQFLQRYGPQIVQWGQQALQFGQQWADKLPGAVDWYFNSGGSAQNLPQNVPQGGNTAGPGGIDPNQFDPWKWMQSTYRQGYEQYYDVTRDPNNYAVHHILPQRFEDTLAQAGINVHDPRLIREVRIVDPGSGIKWHQVYTNEWDAWANALGRAPTAKEIVDRARALETAFSLDGTLNYRQGAGFPGLVDWEHIIQALP